MNGPYARRKDLWPIKLRPTPAQLAGIELEEDLLLSPRIISICRPLDAVVGDIQLLPVPDNGLCIGFVGIRSTPLAEPWWAMYATLFGWKGKEVLWKGYGIGQRLVGAAISLAKRLEADYLCGDLVSSRLEVQPWLPAWYERLGFTVTEARPGAMKDTVKSIFLELRCRSTAQSGSSRVRLHYYG